MSLTISTLMKNIKEDDTMVVDLKQETPDFYSASVNDKYTVQVKNLTMAIGWTSEAKVKVDCECADFMYRWSYVLGKHDALLYPNKYVNEPPKKTNPGLKIGACKHVGKVLRELLENTETEA